VAIDCDSVEQMEREIDQAGFAGLDYWAFVAYPEADPMSRGLANYLAASNRERVRFALLTELDKWGDSKTYRPMLLRLARLMREPTYLTNRHGRPVLFLGFVSDEVIDARFGSLAGLAAILTEFRQTVESSGLPTPFIVLLSSDPAKAEVWMRGLALNALSAYVVADNTAVAAPYSRLVGRVEDYWRAVHRRGLPLVPLVMTGWDRRPRVQTPVPWERGTYTDVQMTWYYHRPDAAELTAHATAAIELARRDERAGGLALVYAWNEFDEGGWLAPTRGEGTLRLAAIRRAIAAACPAGSPLPR
jgi:hypothetical protein